MKRQKGFSLIELLVAVAVIGIIAAAAIPNLVTSRMAANEASAISSVRALVTAQLTYVSTTGNGQYGSMADLQGAQMIDTLLGNGTKQGYTFSLVPNGGVSFTVNASPVTVGTTGTRHFYSDQSGVIRVNTSSTANANDPPLG